MNRTVGMFGRALLPGAGVAMLAVLLQAVIVNLDGSASSLPAAYAIARWVPLAVFLSGLAMAVHAAYWLLRWSDGHGPECSACGGFLGRRRVDRRGPFRVCMGCAARNSRSGRRSDENAGPETHTG